MQEITLEQAEQVGGGRSLFYAIGYFWGSAFAGSGDWYPMAGNYALGA